VSCSKRVFAVGKGKIYLRISAFRRVKRGSELQKRLSPVLLGLTYYI